MLPYASGFDRHAAPDAGGSVEVEKAAGVVTPAVLNHEVAVQNDGLHLRQERILAIDVTPSRLHHADLRIAEIVHNIFEKVRRGNEIRVKDSDQLSRGKPEPILKGARLEPMTI